MTIVSVAGCSSGTKEIASAKDRFMSMMQMLPSNVSEFTFFDVYALRTDENLSSEWSYYNDNIFGFGNDSVSNNINGLCMVYPSNIWMFEGDFTLDQLMGSAANGSYNYGGFNVLYTAYNSSMVLINSTAINGDDEDVRSCIDVVNGNESSLYENENVKAILDRLPTGFVFDVQIVNNVSAAENIGLLLEGGSMAKSGDNDIETAVYQFNTSDAAHQYVATAGNVSKDGTMQIASRTQDGVFVTEVLTPLTSTPTPTETPALTPEPTSTPADTVTPAP